MPLPTDQELLDRFADSRDAQAFEELARRYLNLIHSAAVRRVSDPLLAQDITQAVLMILARRPQAARKSALLSAWLLTTVRYAAANALKMEQRRRRHEERAALAAAQGIASPDPSDVLLWQELAAQLDDAVLKLPARDRQAILLRYFEERPIREVAAALSITEDAAKHRLSRSVSKLRDRLTRQGVSLHASTGAASLAALLGSHAVHAAPAELLSSTATFVAGGSSTSLAIAKGAISMMTWTKIKAAAALLAVASVLGAGTALTINHTAAQQPAAAAQPPAKPATDLQALADARVKAAQKVVDVLTAQLRSGNASVAELGPAQRRLGLARIDAASDAAARKRAGEDYVKQCRDTLDIVKKQQQVGLVTPSAMFEAEYYLADAEYAVAKLP